jgi:hypothetical protein
MNTILDQYAEICRSQELANAAAYSLVQWQDHVQVHLGASVFTHKNNMGKSPTIIIRNYTNTYSLETQPDWGGTRDGAIEIIIMSRVFWNTMEDVSRLLNNIKTVLI